MHQQAKDFLLAILGPDGYQVIAKAADTYPALANALLPKAILTFFETAQASEYSGTLPGGAGQVSLSKSESKLTVESGEYALPPDDLIKMTAILLVNLNETSGIDSKVDQADIGKLSKSLDLLVKHKTNAWLSSLSKAEAPAKPAAQRAPLPPNGPTPPDKGAITGKARKPKLPMVTGMSKSFSKAKLSEPCKTCGSPQLHKRWGTFDGCVCVSKLLRSNDVTVTHDQSTYTLKSTPDLIALVEEILNEHPNLAEPENS